MLGRREPGASADETGEICVALSRVERLPAFCLEHNDLFADGIDPKAVDAFVPRSVCNRVGRLVLIQSLNVLQEPDEQGCGRGPSSNLEQPTRRVQALEQRLSILGGRHPA